MNYLDTTILILHAGILPPNPKCMTAKKGFGSQGAWEFSLQSLEPLATHMFNVLTLNTKAMLAASIFHQYFTVKLNNN